MNSIGIGRVSNPVRAHPRVSNPVRAHPRVSNPVRAHRHHKRTHNILEKKKERIRKQNIRKERKKPISVFSFSIVSSKTSFIPHSFSKQGKKTSRINKNSSKIKDL